MEGRTDRDEKTPWGRTDRLSLHIYTTNLHYTFSPQIFTTNFHARSENSDFHDIFITPVVKIQIFTTFSRHGLDLIFFHQYFTRIFATIGIFTTFV